MAEGQSTETVFCDIPDFPGYRVGSDGSVWSCRGKAPCGYRSGSKSVFLDTWHRIQDRLHRDGYRVVGLRRGGRAATRTVHHLVLLAFVGPCPDGMECCHGDGDRANNHLSNLRWDTKQANKAESRRHGTVAAGERHPLAKLTAAAVAAMRADFDGGFRCYAALARKYGVTENAARQAVHRQTWKHVR